MPEFRAALRAARETMSETAVPQGVLAYTPTNHFGYDARAWFQLPVNSAHEWPYADVPPTWSAVSEI